MSGMTQLRTSGFLNQASGRPEFEIRMKRGFGGLRCFQVICFDTWMLLLDVGTPGMPASSTDALGLAGGLVGGRAGKLLGNALESAGRSPKIESAHDFSSHSDDEVVALARQRKKSLVATYEDFQSVSLEAPGMSDVWCKGGTLSGMVKVKEATLGKVVWEIHDHQSMGIAIEALPAKLGEMVHVNIEFDVDKLTYVKR